MQTSSSRTGAPTAKALRSLHSSPGTGRLLLKPWESPSPAQFLAPVRALTQIATGQFRSIRAIKQALVVNATNPHGRCSPQLPGAAQRLAARTSPVGDAGGKRRVSSETKTHHPCCVTACPPGRRCSAERRFQPKCWSTSTSCRKMNHLTREKASLLTKHLCTRWKEAGVLSALLQSYKQ